MPPNPHKINRARVLAFIRKNYDAMESDHITGELIFKLSSDGGTLKLETKSRGRVLAPTLTNSLGDETDVSFEGAIIILENAGLTVPSVAKNPGGRPKLPAGIANEPFSVSADIATLAAFKALSSIQRGTLIAQALELNAKS